MICINGLANDLSKQLIRFSRGGIVGDDSCEIRQGGRESTGRVLGVPVCIRNFVFVHYLR